MIRVEVYGKAECGLCDEVKGVLRRVQREIPFELAEVDIEASPALRETYAERVPLVFVNGRLAFKFRVDEAAVRRRLDRERRGVGLRSRLRRVLPAFLRGGAG